MYGEHESARPSASGTRGSSPHVRGARGVGKHEYADAGIIPACTGSTSAARGSRAPLRDHPRMYGEHFMMCVSSAGELGSSPHVRGAPMILVRMHGPPGIIPACTGSTTLTARGWTATEGSSPHVRGAPHVLLIGSALAGIIPACTGSTPQERLWAVGGRDHPRMYGEHLSMYSCFPANPGSSPHVRGAPPQCLGLGNVAGIIPACTGSTRP
mgnify:CR=1 FL=1